MNNKVELGRIMLAHPVIPYPFPSVSVLRPRFFALSPVVRRRFDHSVRQLSTLSRFRIQYILIKLGTNNEATSGTPETGRFGAGLLGNLLTKARMTAPTAQTSL